MKDNNDEFIYKYENNIDKKQLVKLFESVGWKTALLVNPEYQKIGLGKIMMNDFMKKFEGFGRRILTTEFDKEEYYKKFGFNIDGIAMFNKDWKEDIEG